MVKGSHERRSSTSDYDLTIDASARDVATGPFPDLRVSVEVPAEIEVPLDEVEEQVAKLMRSGYRELKEAGVSEGERRFESVVPYLRHHDEANRIEVTLQGSSLPFDRSTQDFFDSVSKEVAAYFSSAGFPAIAPSGVVCICGVAGGLPGTTFDLSSVATLVTSGTPTIDPNFFVISLLFPEDTVIMRVPVAVTLATQERTEVVLRVGTGWGKGLAGFHFCKGMTVSIRHPGNDLSIEATMVLNRGRCWLGEAHTLVFQKPKFLGYWHDMYHWLPTGAFWAVHGGRRVIYDWIID
jgi:hypothetical protein